MQAVTSPRFKDNAHRALADAQLQRSLSHVKKMCFARRAATAGRLREFERLRGAARDITNAVLENLDFYLERFEQRVTAAGGQVHWCADAESARQPVLSICRSVN